MASIDKIIASAEITLTDETDASTLTGNMQIVKGSRNQLFLTGQANSYSPNWSKNNLVIRPFLQATNITKTNNGTEYNPDIFDPKEYPNNISTYGYIKDIHWYIRDNAGVMTEILDNDQYGFDYTYKINNINITLNDKRQLVIKDNILNKNDTADIVCRFCFCDTFANVKLTQQYDIALTNIASGASSSKITLTTLTGNTITSNGDQYIDLLARYFGDSGEEDITDILDAGDTVSSCLFYIRQNDNWVLLDPTASGSITFNKDADLYKYMRVKGFDNSTGNYTLAEDSSNKGNAAIRIYPALIDGSEVIKCVFRDYNNSEYYTVEVLYDNTDTTKAELYSSAGTRLKKTDSAGTDIKAVITYKGNLLSDDSTLYTNEFDYYWYRYTYRTGELVNIYNDDKNAIIINTDKNKPISGKRILHFNPTDIDLLDKQSKIMLDITEKTMKAHILARDNFYTNAITEEDIHIASIMCNKKDTLDANTIVFTAKELNAVTKEE